MSRFQILSLDGGGIKGIFSAAILAHFEEDLQVNIIDYFDLVVGTSTGAIIALGLGLGIPPKEIVEFYVNIGPKIFPQNHLKKLRHLVKNKYDSKELHLALKECFGENRLAESKKPLVIPSYNIDDDTIYLFKTPHHERLRRDYKVPMWKVAMATSAAPTYFPCFDKVDHIRLVDGGVWANNPILIGIAEAVSMFKFPLNSVHVFSIGTTNEIKGRSKRLENGGLWQWKKEAVNIIMQGQSLGSSTVALHLLGKDRIIRINPDVPDGLFELDKLSDTKLLSKASHYSRMHTPAIEKIFLKHTPINYKPLYK